jgi:hypothetical protein
VVRKLRIQYPLALYHVIKRGNYRRDVVETVGAAQAIEATLDGNVYAARLANSGLVHQSGNFRSLHGSEAA